VLFNIVYISINFQLIFNKTVVELVETLFGSSVNPREYCVWNSYRAYFYIGYGSVGSLGIAIYRVLYITVRSWFVVENL